MTEEQKAAYVISQSVCAMVEAMGMAARNLKCGNAPLYDDADFAAISEKYGIHHNTVLGVFHGSN